MHYRETGKQGKKVIPLTPLTTWKCSGTHLFRAALLLLLLLIVDTYCSVVVSNLGYFLPVLMWIPSLFDRIG